MKYIYGPVNSRRLGLSLGITLTPYKICSFNCVYCQLGRTTNLTREPKEYVLMEDVLNELKSWFGNYSQELKNLKFITFSGSGEPTLNLNTGQLIMEIKKITVLPIAVITNSSFLNEPLVRRAINVADLIIPSLDAVNNEVFRRINRPCQDINIEEIIDGLVNLRKEFSGKIWLEIMLVRGINDDLRHIKKIREIIDKINPDKIHLNSPVRTTAEPNVLPPDKNKLKQIKEILGDKAQLI